MIPAEMKFYKDDFCKSKKKKKKENPAFDKERQKIIEETNILSYMQKNWIKNFMKTKKTRRLGSQSLDRDIQIRLSWDSYSKN